MRVRTFIPMLLAIAGGACGGSAPARPGAAQGASAAAKKAEPVPEAHAEADPVFEYTYTPVGKRDPFRSVVDDAASLPAEALAMRADCGPLCKWEIEQLKLVAVISGISNPVAMVEDPSGKGFVVRRGSFVGKRNGKVTQIRAGEVVVTEIFKDQMGKPHVNPVFIRMPVEKSSQDEAEVNLLGPEVTE
jgi:type IV pilus assembly protein PilP